MQGLMGQMAGIVFSVCIDRHGRCTCVCMSARLSCLQDYTLSLTAGWVLVPGAVAAWPDPAPALLHYTLNLFLSQLQASEPGLQ